MRTNRMTTSLSACILFLLLWACKKTEQSTTNAGIGSLNCSSVVFSAAPSAGSVFTATASVPYTGGNGVGYSAGTPVSSTGVTGLTAILQAGTLTSGSGNLVYSVSGTPSTTGIASFPISFGGQLCSLSLPVTVSGATTSCDAVSGTAKLVCLADAFKATLSSTQLAAAQLTYTFSNISTWSNLPAAMSARKGIRLGDLNATQLAAARLVIKQMSGSTANEGWDEVQQLWAADDYLAVNGGGSTYGSGNYYLAFFGTPALTGTFEIMMTGHHKTVANTYTNGILVAATPHFAAVEPLSFTSGGATYSPIDQEKNAFAAVLAGLDAAELAAARSGSTFSDLLLGPNANWSFPAAHSGLACSSMTAAQKALVLNAIKTYVNDIDDANAAIILTTYTSELDNTYILFSGTAGMNARNDYFRIDGPHVWIEFSVQNGIIMSGVHYHSVWRDRVNDYGTTH